MFTKKLHNKAKKYLILFKKYYIILNRIVINVRGVAMSVYAMSDLHLALGVDKPMDIFGKGWSDYMQRIQTNWNNIVGDNDIVIVGGDVSWAMYLDECHQDFEYIERLKGKKIILKGNHDYWWESVTKLNNFVNSNGYGSISFLYNNSFVAENYAICGTRGWILPKDSRFKQDDQKSYDRELIRFELSASNMLENIKMSDSQLNRVAVFHYPPFTSTGEFDENVLELLKKYGIQKCIYGHLHGRSAVSAFEGEHDGIKYKLVSSDYMNFEPCNLNF